MKHSIALIVGMFLAAFCLAGGEPLPKPFIELKLDGTAENTGSGKISATIVRPTAVRWGEGREQGKALFLDNDLSNPKKRSIYTALTLPGRNGKFNPATPFTISMWIMPDPAAASRYCALFSTYSGDFGKGIRMLLYNGSYWLEYGAGKKGTTGHLMAWRGKFPIKLGTWNHIAATYDGETCRIYLNGMYCSGKKVKLVPGSDITIGAFLNGYAQPYRGGLSDIRIYKQALTGLQILSIARGDGLK